MKIRGFTYVRNRWQDGFLFLKSIALALLLVDELMIAVGDFPSGTHKAIAAKDTLYA